MSELTLAVDQGTTGTTVLVVDTGARVLGRGYREHPQHFPQPGWVEHDPEIIWKTVLDSTAEALAQANVTAQDIASVGITNQRETIVAWDSNTMRALGPTIVWQDRRTFTRCNALVQEGHEPRIRELTGLPIDPYFSATKAEWLLNNSDEVKAAAASNTLRLGTIDSWLAYRMSGGDAHVTDASNAARTMLFDIHADAWSPELCELFGVSPDWLASVTESSGELARCDSKSFVGISAPIAGIAGDQQAALFGQACFNTGQAKATYGTGAFVLVNSGASAPASDQLISTISWRLDNQSTYALEGSVFTAGASVQWLRDGLQIIKSASEITPLAESVPDSGGVVIVPAFAGLGAPFWDPETRASIMGLSRGSTKAHVARATLEGVAFRVRQVLDAMRSEGTQVHELRVDGGMAANDLLLQIQADVAGIPVVRPKSIETTSLGAAALASLGVGIYKSLDDVHSASHVERVFEPRADHKEQMAAAFRRFELSVAATRSLAQ